MQTTIGRSKQRHHIGSSIAGVWRRGCACAIEQRLRMDVAPSVVSREEWDSSRVCMDRGSFSFVSSVSAPQALPYLRAAGAAFIWIEVLSFFFKQANELSSYRESLWVSYFKLEIISSILFVASTLLFRINDLGHLTSFWKHVTKR